MPQLSDPRHETFCTLRAGGLSATQAAMNAGYTEGSANQGSRLLKRQDIKERIKELNSQSLPTAQDEDKTLQFQRKPWIVSETVTLHRVSKKNQEFSTSLNCLRFLAQLGGLLDGNRGVTGQSGPKSLTQVNIATMTAKQLGEFLRDQTGGLPADERKRLLAAVPELDDLEAESLPATDSQV